MEGLQLSRRGKWTELIAREWSCLHWNQRLGWGMEGGVIHLTKEPTIVTVTVWLLFYFLSLKSNNQQLETGGPHVIGASDEVVPDNTETWKNKERFFKI